MFGHQDENQHQDNNNLEGANEPAHDGVLTAGDPSVASPDDSADDSAVASAPPVDNSAKVDEQKQELVDVNDDTNGLLDIKQQALKQLSPLVSHLDQDPEEKFRTTMMMIQASDDQSLIASAYEAAKQITNEAKRAQALLDIVNEINYFTQASDKETA